MEIWRPYEQEHCITEQPKRIKRMKNITPQTVGDSLKTNGCSINVRVGYGWQKFLDADKRLSGADVLNDIFWQSLKGMFGEICRGVEKSKNVKVHFDRLRASHGRLVWPSIVKRIEKADVLVFDVAAAPLKPIPCKGVVEFSKVLKSLNVNVLLEAGCALGKDKPVMLMCPKHLYKFIPSDLSGFLWTLYKGYFEDGKIVRNFVDSPGAVSAFRGLLLDAWSEKK